MRTTACLFVAIAAVACGGAPMPILDAIPLDTDAGDSGALGAPEGDQDAATGDAGTQTDGGGHTDSDAGPLGAWDSGPTPTNGSYAACAIANGFGAPCSFPGSLDPTECTDQRFPHCLASPWGTYCTSGCTAADVSTACAAPNSGCAPTGCVSDGSGHSYCK